MLIAGCLHAPTFCIGSDDEGDSDEGTTTAPAAPALAVVTIESFRYGNNLSESRIDKTEKVNRYLADHNFYTDAWCIERILKNGESNFYARCLIGCSPIKLSANYTRCDPFRNFIRHRQPNAPTEFRSPHEKKLLLLTQRAERENVSVEDLIRSSVLDLDAVEERSSVFGPPLGNTSLSSGSSTFEGSVVLPREDELLPTEPLTRVLLAAGTESIVVASPFSPQASVLPPPMLSPSELLEHRYPGCFVVNEAQNSYTCSKCFFSSFGLDNAALMYNAEKHLNSEKHAANTKVNRGQQNLFQCGIVSSREQFPSAAALPPPQYIL
jgi:hypothetical protein